MATRSFSLLSGLALVATLLLASVGVVAAALPQCSAVCYVAPTGLDTNEGSALSPKLTIQAGVDQVAVSGAVEVAPGTYAEQVLITKSLTLNGSGASTIIRPASSAALTGLYTYPAGTFWPGTVMASIVLVTNGAAVLIQNLAVDGVNVTTLPSGAARVAGILYGESGGRIDNVSVSTMVVDAYVTRSYGIDLSATGVARTVEVEFSDVTNWSRNGIQAQGASLTADIHDNTLVGPGDTLVAAAVPNGILFIHGVAGNATDNTISAAHTSATSSRSAGILFYDPLTPGIVAEGNDISDTDDGILVGHLANDVIIRGNTLHKNLEVGIHLEDGATNTSITGNTITGNTLIGVRYAGAADPISPDTAPGTGNVVNRNSITDNGDGVVNYEPTTVDATCNWWGAASGPSGAGPGSGDSVGIGVTFSPWLVGAALDGICGADLAIAKSHGGPFRQLWIGSYTITVNNAGGGPSSGTVSVKDFLPVGLFAYSISGSGWTCTRWNLTCTRSTALAPGASYPTIDVRVFIRANVAASVTNVAELTAEGDLDKGNNRVEDPTSVIRWFVW